MFINFYSVLTSDCVCVYYCNTIISIINKIILQSRGRIIHCMVAKCVVAKCPGGKTSWMWLKSRMRVRYTRCSNVLHTVLEHTAYSQSVDWENSVVMPPPLLESLSTELLVHLVEVGPLSVPQIPCHTQAVERAIREVTRVSSFNKSVRSRSLSWYDSIIIEIQKTAQKAGSQKTFLTKWQVACWQTVSVRPMCVYVTKVAFFIA